MDAVWTLDGWLVLLSASFWLHMHATPLALAVMVAVALFALVVIGQVLVALRSGAHVSPPVGILRRAARRIVAEPPRAAGTTVGARGPRAPGRSILRPSAR